MLLVHHPDNDEARFVRCCQLLVLVVPLNDADVALVTLQVLIHAEITAALAFARLEFEHLEQALVAACREVPALLVPAHNIQRSVVRHGDLHTCEETVNALSSYSRLFLPFY